MRESFHERYAQLLQTWKEECTMLLDFVGHKAWEEPAFYARDLQDFIGELSK